MAEIYDGQRKQAKVKNLASAAAWLFSASCHLVIAE
jgi:hypothetical protein